MVLLQLCIAQYRFDWCLSWWFCSNNTLLNTDLIGTYPDGSAPIMHCSIQIWVMLILMVLLQLCIAQYRFHWHLSWWFCSNNTLLNTDLIGAYPDGSAPIIHCSIQIWLALILMVLLQLCIAQYKFEWCLSWWFCSNNTLLNTDLIGAYPDGSAPIIHCSIQIWLALILMVLLQLCIAQYKFEWCLSWWFCSNNTLLNTDLIDAYSDGSAPKIHCSDLIGAYPDSSAPVVHCLGAYIILF